MAWSPDGERLALGSKDSTVAVWDTTGRKRLKARLGSLRGHEEGVTAVAWCPAGADGERFASVSWDRTVRIWDAVRGRCLKTFAGDLAALDG